MAGTLIAAGVDLDRLMPDRSGHVWPTSNSRPLRAYGLTRRPPPGRCDPRGPVADNGPHTLGRLLSLRLCTVHSIPVDGPAAQHDDVRPHVSAKSMWPPRVGRGGVEIVEISLVNWAAYESAGLTSLNARTAQAQHNHEVAMEMVAEYQARKAQEHRRPSAPKSRPKSRCGRPASFSYGAAHDQGAVRRAVHRRCRR